MTFFDIAVRTEASLHADGEPDQFISEHTGVIRCSGDDGAVRRVGRIRAYRINADLAAESGECLFDVCDAHSQEMHLIHSLLYDAEEGHFKEAITRRFQAMESDCLVLDFILLHPRWRGLRLGLLAARKLVDLLGGGCGLVISHIAPLRHDAYDMLRVPRSWLPRHQTRAVRREAVVKLRQYYRQMGFERMGRSPYYGLSLAQRRPTLAELLSRGGPGR
jgi:hypothetical protein